MTEPQGKPSLSPSLPADPAKFSSQSTDNLKALRQPLQYRDDPSHPEIQDPERNVQNSFDQLPRRQKFFQFPWISFGKDHAKDFLPRTWGLLPPSHKASPSTFRFANLRCKKKRFSNANPAPTFRARQEW